MNDPGRERNAANPFPGPFEVADDGEQVLKVWSDAPTPAPTGRTGP